MCVQDGGWTPLMKAAYAGHSEVCTTLLTAKAQPDFQNKVRSSSDDWADWRGLLCVCVQYGDTALMEAASKGYSKVCTTLLTAKAQPDLQDEVRG